MDFSDPPSLLSQQKVASIQLHVTSLSDYPKFTVHVCVVHVQVYLAPSIANWSPQ